MEETVIGPIRFIPGEKHGNYPFCNSIYIDGAAILIDPASDRSRLREIRDNPDQGVREIWLSHWHEDHWMHLDLFEGIPLRISAPDLPPLSSLETFLDWYGVKDLSHRAYWEKIMAEQFHFRPRHPENTFRPPETIKLETVTVRVIPAPGHTPGHVAFYFEEPRVLFTADYDLTSFGPWYGDINSDIDQMISSVTMLRQIAAEKWITSHGKGLFDHVPDEQWDRYLDVIRIRESKLMHLLREPKTLADIANVWIVYGRPKEPKEFYAFGEYAIMGKHLEHLAAQGKVRREGNLWVQSS
jgi:hydroxyacylglutathione hydrolase